MCPAFLPVTDKPAKYALIFKNIVFKNSQFLCFVTVDLKT